MLGLPHLIRPRLNHQIPTRAQNIRCEGLPGAIVSLIYFWLSHDFYAQAPPSSCSHAFPSRASQGLLFTSLHNSHLLSVGLLGIESRDPLVISVEEIETRRSLDYFDCEGAVGFAGRELGLLILSLDPILGLLENLG